MLYTVRSISGYRLKALDGDIGSAKEFYFDDHFWAIRYLVADSGNWLTGRVVLISPHAITGVVTNESAIGINLTKQQIENSPQLDTDRPISRQFEETYYGHFGWPMYWTSTYVFGTYPYPVQGAAISSEPIPGQKHWDSHLRSTNEVEGYHIQALDGKVGHVLDFIIDDVTWEIRYLVIDTRDIWPGKLILISPHWIEKISWDESRVYVTVTSETVKLSPEYHRNSQITAEDEMAVKKYYDEYWFSPTMFAGFNK